MINNNNSIFMREKIQECVNRSCDTKVSLILLVCNIEIHIGMKYMDKKLTLVLFVLATTFVLSSAIDAYAADGDGRGESGNGDIEACLNRPNLPNFPPCDIADEWKGGNITNEASYREGGVSLGIDAPKK